jgi:hypothetical protein
MVPLDEENFTKSEKKLLQQLVPDGNQRFLSPSELPLMAS